MGLDSLLGMELSLPVKAIVVFVVVLVLLAIVTWLFRRLAGDRSGGASARGGRQPRLAVIDAAAVDTRRRLVLIRRDNVEHLIMIGGPTDVVVEQNIVRAVPVGPAREPPGARAPAEPPARAPAEVRPPVETMRPVASPEIAPRAPALRADPADRGPRSFEPRRPSREPPREVVRPQRQPSRDFEPPIDVHPAPPTADANLADMAQRLEAALRRPGTTRESPPREPSVREPPAREPPAREPQTGREPPVKAPAPEAAAQPAPMPTAPSAAPQATSATPTAPGAAASTGSAPQSKPAGTPAAANPPGEPKATRTDAKPEGQKSVLDSLEEEMASLLGRPEKKEG
jgi:flagellar protein FliO/FliZ